MVYYHSAVNYPFTKSLTLYLILANAAAFILQIIIPGFTEFFVLDPSLAFSGYYWQFVSYMFLHGGIFHITINMFVLAIFGFPLEQTMGKNKFLALYFISGMGSAVFYITMMGILTKISLLGASGAVFGVMAAYAFKYPKTWVYIFGLFPLPAAALIVFLLIEEMFYGLLSLQPGIANFGHVGGIVTGLAFMAVLKFLEIRKSPRRDWEFVWE